jgi:Domain of unknown function (4846)
MLFKPLFICNAFALLSCNNAAINNKNQNTVTGKPGVEYNCIKAIPLPDGYVRIPTDSNSFACWLRDISLKKDNTVYLYNGTEKQNQTAQYAVINITVGNKDLQQCADAVMRLRAEYLFAQKRFTEIVFYDNNNTPYSFSAPYTRTHFMNYLQQVFGMCGSASLAKQLKYKEDFNSIEPGDVLIRGGFPGHAVIVADVAVNKEGRKMFMLAQSYMPAQDIHILRNPMSYETTPWYEVAGAEKIITPEYIFNRSELKEW